jgi:aerobic-type carbon monoxide dehydrogenase small subunit (CoxS/CutS family)
VSADGSAGLPDRAAADGVAFSVNGRRVRLVLDPAMPLLYALRNDLGLKGTRFGCGTGHCGTCTVLVDGRPRQSCETPLSAVAGRHVTTVEGLANGDRLDPLQQAFIDEGAGQCGYCLSGIVVAAAALLETNPTPSDEDIRVALDGHLCRCGIQPRIVRAVRRAAGAPPA